MKKVIPSGITFLSLLFGAAALWQFIYAEISTGFYCIFASIVLDGLDGYSARKLDAVTRFGGLFDLIVDYCVFGLFLLPILFRLYNGDAWAIAVTVLFVGCHTTRIIIILSRKRTDNVGMPDTMNPVFIALGYYMGWNLLIVFGACASAMLNGLGIPKLSEFQKKRET